MQYAHILSYIGGKFNIAEWVVSHFPKHTCYVEPFGGAAHVLLRKRASEIEVYNDISQDLVNLFMVAKENPDKLIYETNALPYSRWLYESWLKDWRAGFKGRDSLDWAVRYFYLANTCFSGKFTAGFQTGLNRDSTHDYYNGCSRIRLFQARMKYVLIENMDYFKLIPKYDSPDTFFYCDPPYIGAEDYYEHPFTIADHRKLAELLNNIQGKVAVSYYPNVLVDELYPYWTKYKISKVKQSAGVTMFTDTTERPLSTELLLTNFNIMKPLTAWNYLEKEA